MKREILSQEPNGAICPSLCQSGSKQASDVYRGSVLSDGESYPALSAQSGAALALQTHLAWLHSEERWLTFFSPKSLTHAAAARAGCGHCDGL